jgi:hypothetical protein
VGSYSQAAIPALVLIVLAAPVVWLLIARPESAAPPVVVEPPE